MSGGRIFVVGSLNLDLLQSVNRFPLPGETLAGGELQLIPGGKGANQACAAARLAAPTLMIGKTGRDAFGDALRASLNSDNVDIAGVTFSEKATGTAIVLLLPNGENSIVISSGANSDLTPQEVRQGLADAGPDDLLLCQLETPLPTVAAALQIARANGVTTLLDPAPVCALDSSLLQLVDVLTPNQGEAFTLTGKYGMEAAVWLSQRTGGTVIVKMGELGCAAFAAGCELLIPAFEVAAIDTTAAGDTFNGALAVALVEERNWPEALRFATAAAAISVTRKGAQTSIPTRAEVNSLLKSRYL